MIDSIFCHLQALLCAARCNPLGLSSTTVCESNPNFLGGLGLGGLGGYGGLGGMGATTVCGSTPNMGLGLGGLGIGGYGLGGLGLGSLGFGGLGGVGSICLLLPSVMLLPSLGIGFNTDRHEMLIKYNLTPRIPLLFTKTVLEDDTQ
ncbi:unnamed protein product [Arctia plantaginis]|uniref:Glycine-rich protein n=1 Tax=Arctia plantaginis TaxID=874455 RepID=A0A8S0ZPU6_ARCPL|nr:unnamed protein product [Arctia plantaginis]